MSKPAIDELLDTVSGGDHDHPVWGQRWAGDMDDEDFLMEVDDYLLSVRQQRDDLAACLENMTANRDGWEAVAARVEQQRDRLKEALRKIDADLEGRNFLENSSLRDTARAALEEVGDE